MDTHIIFFFKIQVTKLNVLEKSYKPQKSCKDSTSLTATGLADLLGQPTGWRAPARRTAPQPPDGQDSVRKGHTGSTGDKFQLSLLPSQDRPHPTSRKGGREGKRERGTDRASGPPRRGTGVERKTASPRKLKDQTESRLAPRPSTAARARRGRSIKKMYCRI